MADTTPPTIVFTYRVDGATGISPNTSVVVTFSEDMDTTTINSTSLRIMDSRDNPVFSHVFYDVPNQQALIIPQVGLAYGATYTAAVTTGATDAVGNSLMGGYSFSFTASANPDTTPPTVQSVNPVNGSTCAPTYVPVTATFSEALDPVTLDSGTFSLTGPGNSLVVGTVTYNNRTAAFTPATRLSVASMYTAELPAGITDLASNPLAASYS